MLKYINQVNVKFSPFAKNARTPRIFLSRVMMDEARLLNPHIKINTTVFTDINAQPSISVTFRDGKTLDFATEAMKIDDVLNVVKKHARKLRDLEEANS
ncbi:8511_t:CDS:2 [Ambispora gerdemannii]|uniref:Large ribosomal subunit protein mL53 n=1 Tax=Ambispora gerdemannii TaxID=144530 RepID=A0A9N8W342_9GLOM|nr:8511_t:CDS:2 [Ambispora gerdemannii]